MASQTECRVGAGPANLSEHLFCLCVLPCRPNPTAAGPLSLSSIARLKQLSSEAVASPADLPEHVIVAMLRRENLLTRAKLNALRYDHNTGERQWIKLRTVMRQVGSLLPCRDMCWRVTDVQAVIVACAGSLGWLRGLYCSYVSPDSE